MPASVAHMLIAHKGLNRLKESDDAGLVEFAKMVDGGTKVENYQAYMNLGSNGPDLYYFIKIAKGLKDLFWDGYVKAKAVTPWAYHLHSNRPNVFPLKLIEIVFRDVERKGKKAMPDVNDIRKIAYIAGHLSHIAADQIIHPVVNGIAGPYYKDGKNRKKHREAEVFQDYFLYEEVYRLEKKSGPDYEFFKQDFRGWADCVTGKTFDNTEDWFRYFLQRGFIETYGSAPDEDEIEDAVDGLLLALRVSMIKGPYKKAAKEYNKGRKKSKIFQEYIEKPKYIKYYKNAVNLTEIYLKALYKVYQLLEEGKDFGVEEKKWFCKVVRSADLSCPLEQEILDSAWKALNEQS